MRSSMEAQNHEFKNKWICSKLVKGILMRSSMEARPLSGFYHILYADFVYRHAFQFKKLSDLLSFRAIRALIVSQSRFEK